MNTRCIAMVLALLMMCIAVASPPTAPAQTSIEDPEQIDWPMFQLNYNHSAFRDADAPDTNEIKWKFNLTEDSDSDWVVSSPMIVDGYIYIGSDDGNLYKFDITDGAQVWNYTANADTIASFWSSPCVDVENNMVFMNAGGLHAVDLETGEQVWYFDTSLREFSSPVVYDGVVFFGTYNQYVYALDEFTGDVVWYYEAGEYEYGQKVEGSGGAVSTTLAITDTMVFGAEQTTYSEEGYYCDYNIFSLPREDPNGNGVIEHSEIFWKYEIGEHIPLIDFGVPIEGGESFGSPTVNEELGQVYIGSRDMFFYCFAIEPDGDGLDNDGDGIFDNEGELIWRRQTDNEIFPTATYDNGTIFFGTGTYSTDNPGSMYALSEVDGSVIWTYDNSDGFLSSPLVADGKIFIGANDDRMYVFDEFNGTVLWEYHVQEGGGTQSFGSSPALYEGIVVIGCCNSYVYAFGEADDGTGSGTDSDDEDDGFFGNMGTGGKMLIVGMFLIILILVGLLFRNRQERTPEDDDAASDGEDRAIQEGYQEGDPDEDEVW